MVNEITPIHGYCPGVNNKISPILSCQRCCVLNLKPSFAGLKSLLENGSSKIFFYNFFYIIPLVLPELHYGENALNNTQRMPDDTLLLISIFVY